MCVCQVPLRGAEAHREDGVPAAVCVSPGGAVSAALPAGEDQMHAGGKATHTPAHFTVTHLDSSKQSLMGEGADLIRPKPLNT